MGTPCAVLNEIPEGFLDCPPEKLVTLAPRPMLFDLKGRDPHALFVSVLLHGNEDTGLRAVQQVLRHQLAHGLNRDLLLFVGNVEAAAVGVRTLPHQLDFNRIWPGTPHESHPLVEMGRFVFDYAAKRNLVASVDIHNNTGFNPHYGCISRVEPKFISLARLFSRTVVHFQRPRGTQAAAFAALCPAVTVECGKAGQGSATQHAAELVEACLGMSSLSEHVHEQDVDLLRTYAIVKPPEGASFSFDGAEAAFMFRPDIDHLNFSELEAGAPFGRLSRRGARLDILPGDGDEAVDQDYFDYSGDEIRLAKPAIPAMLTLDPNAVRLDCLCYLMHRIGLDGRRK